MMGRPWVFAAWLLAACAQVHEPTGGERDTQGPRLLGAAPAQFSTHFAGDRIVLRFDERIRLDRPGQKMLISPPLAAPPTVRLQGADAVVIDLEAPLEPNTTYTFNLGDAVLDLSESNPAAGLTYVISTGGAIDSLLIAGRVENAATTAPEKEVLVMLYAAGADPLFRTGAPLYFTRSAEDGTFILEHLRPGAYEVFALRDQNGDLRYDLPNEEIAFGGAPVEATDSASRPLTLRLFREESAGQMLVDARVIADGALRVVTALPIASPRLDPLAWSGGSLTWTMERGAAGDTLLAWPSDTTRLRDRLFVLRDDTTAIDTLRYLPAQRMPYYVDLRLIRRPGDGGAVFQLRSSRPIARIDQERVRSTSAGSAPLLVRDAADPRLIGVDMRAAAKDLRALELLPGAVIDLYGGGHDTLRFDLALPDAKETGSLEVKGARSGGHVAILHVLDKHGGAVREAVVEGNSFSVRWDRLPPQAYTLELIEDRDGNGRWTTGSLSARRQPEPVWRHPDPVNLRAGWEMQVEWEVR